MKAEIRNATQESEKEWGAKMQIEEKDVPLEYRRWKPLPEGEFLDLDPRNPRELQWRRQRECVLEQRRKQRCYKRSTSGEEDGDIYNLCSRAKW